MGRPRSGVVTYLLLVAFRVFNVFLIQSQFDPDEYWQQLEPAYCVVFGDSRNECAGLTWEWKRTPPSTEVNSLADLIHVGMEGPVRSYMSIVPTLLFYSTIKFLKVDLPWMVSRGPVFLNAILVAAPTDWAVWFLSRWLEFPSERRERELGVSTEWWGLYCSLTSWFAAYALSRTYSNSLETVLLALSLCLVSPELLREPDPKKATASRYGTHRACLAFFIGGLTCSIRFTCLAAFIPMGLLLAFQRVPSQPFTSACVYLAGVCAICGILGILVTVLFDRYMYGFLAIPILGNIHFNVILGNGSLYGTHPFYWYLIAGIPAVVGILLPFLVFDLVTARKWSPGRRNLWLISACYVVAHSYSDHKEFRFLLPILPLLSLISAEPLRHFCWKIFPWNKTFLILGAAANLVAVLYLGLLHQRAPIEVNRYILELGGHEPQTYAIHYLMGCHSTPLLSHLHNPPVKFEPWTLDCSPDCRADPLIECESDSFSKNPGKFMEETYFQCSDVEVGTCVTDSRLNFPDFLVANAEDLPLMKSRITTMGMKEVGRFVHGINGLRIGSLIAIGAASNDFEGIFSTTKLFRGAVWLTFDEFVLFENQQVRHRY